MIFPQMIYSLSVILYQTKVGCILMQVTSICYKSKEKQVKDLMMKTYYTYIFLIHIDISLDFL